MKYRVNRGVHSEIQWLGYVSLQKVKPAMTLQRADVALGPGQQVIDTPNLVIFLEQPSAQMRSYQTRSSGNDDLQQKPPQDWSDTSDVGSNTTAHRTVPDFTVSAD
jgi:hypothetical protein